MTHTVAAMPPDPRELPDSALDVERLARAAYANACKAARLGRGEECAEQLRLHIARLDDARRLRAA